MGTRIPLETSLVSLNPRDDCFQLSQGRTVLVTGRDGWIDGGPDSGLFFHQTRIVSRHRLLLDGLPPRPAALSSVEQHSWLGYYLAADETSGTLPDEDRRRLSLYGIEIRVSRFVGSGLHEDLDLISYSGDASLRLE